MLSMKKINKSMCVMRLKDEANAEHALKTFKQMLSKT